MKKAVTIIAALAAGVWVLAARADTWTDPATGIAWTYTVSDGKASVGGGMWDSPAVPTSTTGALAIPSKINGYPVTSIGVSAFYNCRGLTSVTIPDSVTSIGSYAFYYCSGLTSVTMPDSVTSIGDHAFRGCSGLTSVTIPDGVTSIGNGAFGECRASLFDRTTIPGVEIVDGWAVGNTGSLSGDLNLTGVRGIGGSAFSGCSGLTSVTIPGSVMSIGDRAFYGCSRLTGYVVDIGNPQYASINGLLLSKNGTELLYGINGDVTIPDGVTNIAANAFLNCSGLTSVTIPDSVTSIGSYAFYGCSGLTSVTIPNSVTSIDSYAFYGCSGLVSVSMPSCMTGIGQNAFMNCSALVSISIPEGIVRVQNQCFYGCTSLEEVVFPSTLRTIACITYASSGSQKYDKCAFYGCGSGFKHICFNGPPITTYGYTNLINQCYNARISYAREYAAQWQKVLALNRFAGFSAPNTNLVEVVSCGPRETDPSILDVIYKVKSDKPTVKVRALAYLDGVRSFANVVRMESLVDGTSSSVGDSVTANEEHTISWKASDDLAMDLAHVTVEVLVVENDLLPLEVIRIPANDDKRAMEISWNVHSKEQVFDALLWLYADHFTGLQLTDGVLAWNGKPLLSGAEFYTTQMREDPYSPGYMYEEWTYHTDDAIDCVYHAMGFQVLKGAELEYANKMTRLGLEAPDVYYGEKNYAYRWLNAGN